MFQSLHSCILLRFFFRTTRSLAYFLTFIKHSDIESFIVIRSLLGNYPIFKESAVFFILL